MSRHTGRIGYKIGKATVSSRQIEHKKWDSTCVADLQYDPETETCTCEFAERGTYEYANMPPDVFAEWNNSGSRGTYFNLYIRSQFESQRIA
jgi:hypothetical protein